MINLLSFDEERELLLTEEVQRESVEYLEELKKLEAYGRKIAQKKVEAEKEIPNIKGEIALLNAEYYKENDPGKLKEIEDKRLKLRLKLDDLEGLASTNIKAIIKEKFLKDLEGYDDKARAENMMFRSKVGSRKEYFYEVKRKVEEKIQELTLLEHMHAYNRAIELKDAIKRMDYIQNDGWISNKNEGDTSNKTNFLFSDGVVYGAPRDE